MAKCQDCKKDMLTADSCTITHVEIDGKVYPRNTAYHDINERCHDCNIINGNFHHFGCDIERCPKCGEQFIGCNCGDRTPKV